MASYKAVEVILCSECGCVIQKGHLMKDDRILCRTCKVRYPSKPQALQHKRSAPVSLQTISEAAGVNHYSMTRGTVRELVEMLNR